MLSAFPNEYGSAPFVREYYRLVYLHLAISAPLFEMPGQVHILLTALNSHAPVADITS